jgi:ketosteroid isomerase-like protein
MENSTITSAKTNVEIVQENISEFLKGNIAHIINNCTDDVVWSSYRVPGIPLSDTFHGKEGVQEYFQQLSSSINFTSFSAKEFLSQGNLVVVLGNTTGVVKTTGKSFEYSWCMQLRLKDGKTYEYFINTDSYQIFKSFQE